MLAQYIYLIREAQAASFHLEETYRYIQIEKEIAMDKKQEVLAFIKTQRHAVIATTDGQMPEAALVGFGEAEDLTLIIGTSKTSRKYRNIQKHNVIALVFGFDETSVQYEGKTSKLEGEELNRYKTLFFSKNPNAQQYESHPEQIFFKVTPTWIRYVDFSSDPKEIFEILF